VDGDAAGRGGAAGGVGRGRRPRVPVEVAAHFAGLSTPGCNPLRHPAARLHPRLEEKRWHWVHRDSCLSAEVDVKSLLAAYLSTRGCMAHEPL